MSLEPTRAPSGLSGASGADDLLLKLAGVHTHIGAYHILHGVDLEVSRGRTTLLLGRNGAGKTTTLRTIMGLWRASAGTIDFSAAPGREERANPPAIAPVRHPLHRLATPEIARLGLAYVPENMGIFSDLTVRENMALAARAARGADDIDAERLRWIFDLFPAMKRFWNHPAGLLSGGQKQMLAVSRAIVEPRALILIDEPSKGLAPSIIQNMLSAFRQLKAAGVTILLVEQNFAFARQLGDSVAVMDDGRVVHAGPMAELADDEALQQRLLGLSLGAHQ
ncbi:MAG: hypothetical protein RIS35_292 [Pseudomonadota bacterium]|jgi:branched-chain amino acid transport system ATP-binding protein